LKRIKLDSAQSAVRATVARALAEALILGIDNAEVEGHSLTQLQQVDLATMHVMAYVNALDTCATLQFEARISKG